MDKANAAASSFIAAYSVHKSMGSLMGATYLSVADTVWTLSSIYIGRNNPETLALASQSVRLFAVCLPMYFVAYMFDDYLIIRI